MGMVIFLLIIIVIVLIGINDGKEKEIKKLNTILNSSKNKSTNTSGNNFKFCPECGCDLVHYNDFPSSSTESIDENNTTKVVVTEEIKNAVIESKPKYTDKEIKNSLILITGSVLVIISALLFLTTTWSFTNSFIKTFLLVLMLIVFFAASHIADKVLHLKQTAKAFRYIGLYFLPIVLFSISLFGLLGHELSLFGPNKYVYLFFSSLIVTIAYYYSSVKHNSTLIKVSTIIFSIITLIVGTLIFTTSTIIVMIILFLYLFILSYLYSSNRYLFDENIHLKTLITLLISFSILSFNALLINCRLMNFIDILLDIIMFVNIYYFFCRIINKKNIFENIYPIYIILLLLHFSGLFDNYLLTQLLVIISFLGVTLAELSIHKSMSLGSYIEILASSCLIYLFTFVYRLFDSECLQEYFYVIIDALVSLIYYFSNEKYDGKNYKFSAYVFSSSILCTILNIILVHKLSNIYLGYASLCMISATNFYKKKNTLSKSFFIVGNIGFVLSTIIMDYSNIFTSVLFLFFTLYNVLMYFDNGKKLYRYISYIYYNLHLISLLLFFNNNLFLITNDFYLIIPITTILFVILEKLVPRLDDKDNHIYLLIQFIISIALLVICELTIPNLVLFFITCLEFVYYIRSIDYNEEWLLCPYLGIIIYLHIKFLPSEYSYFINIFSYLSLGILALFGYKIFKNKRIMYSVLYYLTAFSYILIYSQSKYFSLLLIFVGTFIAYLVKRNVRKDWFKAGLFVCVLILARFLIKDLYLESSTMINIGIYILWVPLITRLIIRKYSTEACKIIEYIANIIINMWAFFSYTSEYDGLLFVLLLVMVVIVSYCVKFGPVFLVSICSIIINVLILTREFWLTIPWWIYVLLIGIILISFAVYNEINANKKKVNVIKELSKKIDI